MRKFFVLKKGKYITGPFTLDQLRVKEIKETDKIWHDGLTDWQPAVTVEIEGISVSKEAAQLPPKKSLLFWKKRS